MVPIDTDEALAALKAGRIDAMFFVAGLPVRLLAEGVTAADGLALVPITNKDIAEFYPRATIAGNAYGWQPSPVETVAVKAVLVSFDFRKNDCENVGKFAQIVSNNIEWLTKNGHPKWKALTEPRVVGRRRRRHRRQRSRDGPVAGRQSGPRAGAVAGVLGGGGASPTSLDPSRTVHVTGRLFPAREMASPSE